MRVSSDVNRPTSPEVVIVPWLAGAAWPPRGQVEAWPSRNLKMWMFALDLVIRIPSASSSQSDQPDVDDDGEVRPPVTDDSCLFVQVASLKNVAKNIPCPICQGDLTVVVVDKKKGPVVGLRTECTSCGHVFSETLSSGKIGDRGSQSPFATTRRLVAGTMDCGDGFS